MNCKKKTGWWAALAAIAVFVASPATAVPGLGKYVSTVVTNSVSPKTATAYCPAGQQVIGGGAWVDDSGAGQVVLTRMQPIHDGTQDRYVVSAEEPAAGFSGNWWLQAYAICANPLAGYEIVAHTTNPDSPTFVETSARCPSGKLVTGTGSRILNSGGQVGIQLSRSSGPLDISRSTARERANGYSGDWTLTSYAICANPVNLVYEDMITNLAGSQLTCPTSTHRVHSVGGGGALDNSSGPVFLQILYPFNDMRTVQVFMTGPANGGMVITAICGP